MTDYMRLNVFYCFSSFHRTWQKKKVVPGKSDFPKLVNQSTSWLLWQLVYVSKYHQMV